jgi:3-oxoadipate enol-lactonase
MFAAPGQSLFTNTNMSERNVSGTVMTRDGMTLHYNIAGAMDSTIQRLVLIHSLGMAGSIWDLVVDRLSDRAAILTYDCRGHGASTKHAGPYRLETFADDLADILDHAGWQNAHIAGGSMGGCVAMQFAVSWPRRVLTLGLLDTTAWYGPEAAANWDARARQAEEKGMAALLEFQRTRWFSDEYRADNPPMSLRCSSIFLANDVASFAATCRMLGAFDLRQALTGIGVPTAVAVGEQDYATPPAMARDIVERIRDATLQVIPNARHLTFVERPPVIADLLSELMDRHKA